MPNYARLFAEAVTDSVRDYLSANPEILVPGYWWIRLRKGAPMIPARTYLVDHEPGHPENLRDRSSNWILVGEIAGEPADPLDIFGGPVERQTLKGRGRLTPAQEYAYQTALVRHAQTWDPDNPLAHPRRPVKLTHLPPIPPPGE